MSNVRKWLEIKFIEKVHLTHTPLLLFLPFLGGMTSTKIFSKTKNIELF